MPRSKRYIGARALAFIIIVFMASAAEAKVTFFWQKNPEVTRVVDIQSPGFPDGLIVFNGALYYRAGKPGSLGYGLWEYDGNTASLAADINVSTPYMAVYDGALYFIVSDTVDSYELWKYDGNTASLVTDLNTAPDWPRDLTVYDNALYFTHYDDVHGRELWRYDSTTATLVMVEIRPGQESSKPRSLTVFDGALYFIARQNTNSRDLWKYDGNNLSLAADVTNSPHDNVWQGYLTVFDGDLYLLNIHDAMCGELCKYDGSLTPVSINVATDIVVPIPGGTPAIWRDQLYFAADDTINGLELWRFDGQTALLSANIAPGPLKSHPIWLTVFDDELLFAADDGSHGHELFWGNSLVEDIWPGSDHSIPQFLTVFDKALYFIANDGVHGRDLWRFKFNKFPKFYIELIRPWEEFWLWPIDPMNEVDRFVGTVAVLALADGEAPRLLARRSVNLGNARAMSQPVYESSLLDPERLPPALGLLSVLLHDATGRVITSETDVVALKGEPDHKTRERLTEKTRTFLEDLTIDKLRAMEVKEFAGPVAQPPAVQQPSEFRRMLIFIFTLILVASVVMLIVFRRAKSR